MGAKRKLSKKEQLLFQKRSDASKRGWKTRIKNSKRHAKAKELTTNLPSLTPKKKRKPATVVAKKKHKPTQPKPTTSKKRKSSKRSRPIPTKRVKQLEKRLSRKDRIIKEQRKELAKLKRKERKERTQLTQLKNTKRKDRIKLKKLIRKSKKTAPIESIPSPDPKDKTAYTEWVKIRMDRLGLSPEGLYEDLADVLGISPKEAYSSLMGSPELESA